MDVAKQIIWHQAYERALKTITSLRNHCDFKYEKDSKNAKEVRILNAVKPTVKKYVPGTAITRESVSATSKTLYLDQAEYINVSIDDVVKAQTVEGAMEAFASEGAIALSEKGDQYVASLIKEGVEDGDVASLDAVKPTKDTSIDLIEDAFAVLYANNCPVNTEYYLEVGPTFYKYVRPNMTELLTTNVDMVKKGIVGKYANAMITIENLLPEDDDSTLVYNVLRTKKAIAYAEQINHTETYRVQDGFEDAIKALYTYGALIVRPEEMIVIPTLYVEPEVDEDDNSNE